MASIKEVTYEKLMIIKYILTRIFIVFKMDSKVRGLNLVLQEYDQGAWLKQQQFFGSLITEFNSVEHLKTIMNKEDLDELQEYCVLPIRNCIVKEKK
jgi:hypothetical protein